MFHIVLVQPRIPQNTGNIGRIAVSTESVLHLIQPFGFSLDEASLRRAGLDYWPHLDVRVHESWRAFLAAYRPQEIVFLSTKGKTSIYRHHFAPGCFLVFGNETRGLPPEFYSRYQEQLYTIPLPGENARSLNLANAVSIVVYEGLRQINFKGLFGST